MKVKVLITSKLILLIAIAILVFSGTFVLFQNNQLLASQNFQVILNTVLLAEFALLLISWILHKNSFISISGIFLLYYVLSMGGQTLLQFIPSYKSPNDKIFDVYYNCGVQYVNKMLLFQIAFAAFMLVGIEMSSLYIKSWERKNRGLINNNKKFKIPADNIIFNILFLVLFAYLLYDAGTVLLKRQIMSYGQYYTSDDRQALSTYLLFAISALFVYTNITSTKKIWKNATVIMLLVLVALYMIAGTRSRGIPYVGLIIAVLFELRNTKLKRIPWWVWLLILFAGIEALGFVSMARRVTLGTYKIQDFLKQGVFQNLLEILDEMGISAETVTYTIKATDNGLAHQQSFFYYGIISVVPGPVLNLLGIHAPEVGQLSEWVTDYAGSVSAGLGYSLTAEAYMNFGFFGAFVGAFHMFAMPVLEKISVFKAKRGFVLFPCIMITILCKFIFSARAQFDLANAYLRLGFYFFIVWFLLYKLSFSNKSKKQIRRDV